MEEKNILSDLVKFVTQVEEVIKKQDSFSKEYVTNKELQKIVQGFVKQTELFAEGMNKSKKTTESLVSKEFDKLVVMLNETSKRLTKIVSDKGLTVDVKFEALKGELQGYVDTIKTSTLGDIEGLKEQMKAKLEQKDIEGLIAKSNETIIDDEKQGKDKTYSSNKIEELVATKIKAIPQKRDASGGSPVFIKDNTRDRGYANVLKFPNATIDIVNNETVITTTGGGGGAVDSVNGQTGVVVLDQDDIGDGATYKQYSDTEKTKLAGIEAGANVTDATNVNAAGAVMNSDYTPAHSILVQQSGTGSPTALSIGNNTLVGRLSGGGSDIDDLSSTDVRTLLSISNVDNTSDLSKPISTATQTALDLKANLAGATFSGDIIVPTEAYGSGWNGSNEVPTKNDLYDKIETLGGGGTPGGVDTDVQYNDGGVFNGGVLKYNKTTKTYTLVDTSAGSGLQVISGNTTGPYGEIDTTNGSGMIGGRYVDLNAFTATYRFKSGVYPSFHTLELKIQHTADRTIYVPDADGTLALTSDLGAYSTFVALTDTPASYTGEAGKVTAVNGTEDGLEFIDIPTTSPGGADTQIQYNNGGSFGGIAPLTWDDTNQVLNIDITDDEVIPISYFQGYVHNTGATEYSYFAISRDTLLFQTSGNAIFEAGAMSFQTSNELYNFYGDNGSGVFDLGAVTDDRTYTLPDASGTIALTSNIPTLGTGVATALGINVGSAGAFATLAGTETLSNKTLSGATVLEENASLQLDGVLSADGKWSGTTITGTAGYTQAFGDLVTLDKDDSRREAVDISVAAAATGDARGLLGMVVVAGTDGTACTILLQGTIRADANFPALTIGAPVYASTTGDIVVTQPSTTDYVIRIIGSALTADSIYFSPGVTWITHT